MEQLPKIVQERLQARGGAGDHPDANLLAAYSENTLRESERASVQEHLAGCGECRQIVSLAAPQPELELVAAAAAAPAPARKGWIFHGGLRWAAVAAAVVVAGAVVLHYRDVGGHNPAVSPTLVALQKSAPAPAAPAAKDNAALSASTGKPDQKESDGALRQKETAALAPPPAPAGRGSADAIAELDIREKKIAAAPLARFAAPPGSAPRPAIAESRTEAASANPSTGNLVSRDEAAKREFGQRAPAQVLVAPASPPANQQNEPATVSIAQEQAAAPGAAGASGGAIAMLPMRANAKSERDDQLFRQASANVATFQWSLSSDGTMLMRSQDAGHTWQTIPSPDGVIVRAIAALGPQIWIGGLRGALYHSFDAGQHWNKLEPSAAGQTLSFDIVHLEFTDAQHGTLKTAGGTIWTTLDGGKTWQENK